MKDIKYLKVTVTRIDGTVFDNPLKISEAHLISKMAQQHKSVFVRCVATHKADYKSIFG